MERAKSSIIAWLMLCGIAFSQEPASLLWQLDEMLSRIRHLEDQVQSLSDHIEKRQPIADKGTKQIPADSQTTVWDPDFPLKSQSVAWQTNSLGMAEQFNLYQFVTNGTYTSSITTTNWGYTNANDFAALVRHNVAGGVPTLKYAKVSTMPDGSNKYDVLYWETNSPAQWKLLDFPGLDTDDTGKYQVLQKKADNSLGWDWIRLHP